MFNPFAPLSQPLLRAFIKAGKTHFVRQTFTRAKDHFDERIKGCFILTHYSEAGHAQHHMSAISHDPYRFMYDWNEPDHQSKLTIAAGNPPGYKIYSAVFENDWEKRITAPLRQKAKIFIETRLKWQPGSKAVSFNICYHYGELYVRLRLKGHEVRVKLEDIENVQSVSAKPKIIHPHELLLDFGNTH